MQDFAHQTEIFELSKNRRYYGLLMETGTGKTRVAIKLAEHHHRESRISAVMVLTTKGLVRNWSDIELPAHATTPYYAQVWPNKVVSHTYVDKLYWWLVNIDAILTDGYVTRIREFMEIYPSFMCIVDESTIIKTPAAKRTRRAWKIGQRAKARLIMSGLPTPRSPLDLYAQCRFLSPAALGFPTFAAFKLRHADVKIEMLGNSGRSYPKITGYKNLGELKEKLSRFSSIITRDECLDLPENQTRIFPVPLTRMQRKHYDELRTEMITIIKGEVIDAKIIIAMINKCLQICSGQIKLPNGNYLELETNRPEVLQELVEECEGQTLIWTAFANDGPRIKKVLDKETVLLPSPSDGLDRYQDILADFKAGNIKSMVAKTASSAHGLTLVNTSNVIYYSRLFNYEHRKQSMDRTVRIGQTKSCLFTDLADLSTLERKVINVLDARKEMAEFMMDRNFFRQMLEEPEEVSA